MITQEDLERLEGLRAIATMLPHWDPLFVPPSLTDPNYVRENKGPKLIILICFWTFLLLIGVGARLYVRKVYVKKWYTEDWLCLAAMGLILPFTSMNIYAAAKQGLGLHSWDLTVDQAIASFKLQYAHVVLYSFSTLLVKLVIIASIHRLESSAFRKKICIVLGGLTIITTVTCVLFVTFGCPPVTSAWDLYAKSNGHCASKVYKAYFYVGIILFACVDMACLLLPAPLVWSLRLPLRRKLEVAAIFSIGAFAVIVAFVRIKYLYRVLTSFDVSWASYPVVLLDTVELDVGLLSTCIPLIRLFFQKKFPTLGPVIRQSFHNLLVFCKISKTNPVATKPITPNESKNTEGSGGTTTTGGMQTEEDSEHTWRRDIEKGPTFPHTPDSEAEERRRRLELRYRMAEIDLDELIPEEERERKLLRISRQLDKPR